MTRTFLTLLSVLVLILSFPTFDPSFLVWVGHIALCGAMKKALESAVGISLIFGSSFLGRYY